MSTFVIVHGAWGSPAEMEPVVAPLEAAGHAVVLVDLPCTAADAGLEDYVRAVEASLPADLTDVILVGHSFGGFTVSTVAAKHPRLPVVFVAAVIPEPDASLVDIFLGSDPFEEGDEPGIAAFGGLVMADGPGRCALDIDVMAADVDPAERDDTIAYLRRTQRSQGIQAMRQKWQGALPSDRPLTYVVATADTLLPPDDQRAMAASIGAVTVGIDTDHSAFGEQPEQLAALLSMAAASTI